MRFSFDFLNRPEVLRELRELVIETGGIILALLGARKLSRRRATRKARRDYSRAIGSLADSQRRTNNPATANCVYCLRSPADVATLGCGGPDRKGQCPR